MRFIVAGSREFTNWKILEDILPNFITPKDEIVCGGARGGDAAGKKYAESHNIPIKIFPANWDKYGKSAGYIRNAEMGEYGDVLIAFWDKQSRGTLNMIKTMQLNKKPYYIYDFQGKEIVKWP